MSRALWITPDRWVKMRFIFISNSALRTGKAFSHLTPYNTSQQNSHFGPRSTSKPPSVLHSISIKTLIVSINYTLRHPCITFKSNFNFQFYNKEPKYCRMVISTPWMVQRWRPYLGNGFYIIYRHWQFFRLNKKCIATAYLFGRKKISSSFKDAWLINVVWANLPCFE